MTISSDDLFMAILAMDSYNRGYNQGIDGLSNNFGTQIGNAYISVDDTSAAARSAGFYAIAYTLISGQVVISYRGTDNQSLSSDTSSGGSDVLNGWTIGAGYSNASQAVLAEQFYQAVTEQYVFSGVKPDNVILTGHSLGGGLAAFIGTLTGLNAVIFDNMPFGAAAVAAIASQDASIGLSDIGNLFTNSQGQNFIPLPSTSSSNITQYYTTGEILSYARLTSIFASNLLFNINFGPLLGTAAALYGEALDDSLSANSGQLDPQLTSGNSVTPVDLHSQALLVTLMYASMKNKTTWVSISNWLIKAMSDDSIGKAVGFGAAQDGGAFSSGYKMLSALAYTAIPDGEQPFGTTALASLFGDADVLGEIFSADNLPSALKKAGASLSQIVVEYAGLLAKNKDTNQDKLNKIFDVDDDRSTLAVDLTKDTWKADGGTVDEIVGRKTFIDQIFSDGGNYTNLHNDLQNLWNDSKGEKIGRIVFALSDGDINEILPDPEIPSSDQPITAIVLGDGKNSITGTSGDDFVIGGSGGDTINGGDGNNLLAGGDGDDSLKGGSGKDVLLGGAGNDTLIAGSGSDSLFGGDGNDSLTGGSGKDYLSGGSGNDTIRGGMGADTISAGSGDNLIILLPNQSDDLIMGSSDDLLPPQQYDTTVSIPNASGNTTINYEPVSSDKGANLLLSDKLISSLNGSNPAFMLSGSDYGSDEISGVQTIKLTGQKDTLTLSLDSSIKLGSADAMVVDGGDQPSGAGDVLDASSYQSAKPYILARADGSRVQFGGIVIKGDSLNNSSLTFKNFEILYGTDNGDVIAGKTSFKNIYLGDGNNLVQNISGATLPGQENNPRGRWVTLYLGTGDSTVEGTTAAGSEIFAEGTAHHDKIDISPDILIHGLTENDEITVNGNTVLHGGTRNEDSDDPWAYDNTGNYRFGINSSGQLVIDRTNPVLNHILALAGLSPVDSATYVADFQNGVTAGITLLDVQTWGGLLLKRPANLVGSIIGTMQAIYKIATTWTDPLVLDLKGTGIDLTPLDTAGGRSDLNGSDFAVTSSWATPDEGILVTVDGAGNVKAVEGFNVLASYDLNGDGVVDDLDLSNANFPEDLQLRIFVDSNGNHQVDSGELLTLDQAGVRSISVTASTAPAGTIISDSQVLATGAITLSNGTTSAIDDLNFNVDNFDTTYLGNTEITANAAALPNLFGHGTLPDLSVALSTDERAQIANGTLQSGSSTTLETLVGATVSALSSTPDIAAWRVALQPVFEAWAQAFPNPAGETTGWWTTMLGPDGQPLSGSPELSSYELVTTDSNGNPSVDHLQMRWANVSTTKSDGTVVDELKEYYVFESGRPVTDGAGTTIAEPTLAQALAMPLDADQTWQSTPSRPNYYAVTQTDSAGKTTYVDDLEYTTTTIDVAGTDPITGEATTTSQTIGYWVFGSGRAVTDANGSRIDHPTLEQALATQLPEGETWDVFTADELNFLERYSGERLPLGEVPTDQGNFIAQLDNILKPFNDDLNLLTLRLVVQGPLADSIFAGITYDVAKDDFAPTTNRGLEPVYEAIFDSVSATAASDPTGTLATLSDWNDVLQGILNNFDRGADYLAITPTYYFANIVAAYEASGLQLPIADVVSVMGVNPDYLHAGTSAGTTVDGGTDQNLFYVDSGNNDYVGHNATDSYVVGGHFGNSTINDSDDPFGQKATLLRFANLDVADLTFTQDGADLVITRNDTGETLRIVDQFTFAGEASVFITGNMNTKSGIDTFIFADGTTWDTTDLSFAVAQKNTHDVVVRGSTGHDVLFAGPGDTLTGGPGIETYVYEAGSGSVTIDTQNDNAQVQKYDTLIFGPGITQDDVVFGRVGTASDLTISIKGTSDVITVKGQFDETFPVIIDPIWFNRIDLFQFSDGSTIDATNLMRQMIQDQAASGVTSIYGFSGNDVIDPGVGNKFMSGGNGNDVYVYDLGDGHDSIDTNENNFISGGEDSLVFGDGITAQNIKLEQPAGTEDLLITTPDGGGVLIQGEFDVIDTPFGELRYHYIHEFVFADGTTLSAGQLVDLMWAQQEAKSDVLLTGASRPTTFDDPHGNVTMEGDDFGNTYVFGRGYGNDTILQNPQAHVGEGTPNTVAFGADIAPTDLVLSQGASAADLVIRIAGTSDQLTVLNTMPDYASPNQVQQFTFADGTVWSLSEMEQALLQQESDRGQTRIVGFAGDDVLDGSQGNQYLSGGLGNDTYVYSRNAQGNDTIDDGGEWLGDRSNNDALVFTDLASTDVAFYREGAGDTLLIKILPTGRTISVSSQFGGLGHIERFQFSDGVTLTSNDVETRILASEVAANYGQLFGFKDAITINAGSGNKFLASGGGATTYVYSADSGNDTIDNGGSSPSTLVLSNLNASDIEVGQVSGSNDVILDLSTGKNITIRNQISGQGVQSIQFQDGSVWSAQDIVSAINPSLIGTVLGTGGNDTLVPDTRDTFLSGGNGVDTYEYSSVDGNDTILGGSDQHYSADNRTLILSDLSLSDVAFRINGADLLLDVNATGKTLTIAAQYDLFSENTIGSITFADGTTLSALEINAMIMEAQTTSGAHDIIGFISDDTLVAGLGDRYMSGGGGYDTYVYSSAGGNDTIWAGNDQHYGGYLRTLVFSDLNVSDISFQVNGADLMIGINATGKTLTIQSQNDHFQEGTIGSFQFADGSILTNAQINALILDDETASGSPSIIGFASDDTITAGTGDRYLAGGGEQGRDVFVYSSLGGNDTIDATSSVGSVLHFTDINSTHTSFVRSGNDLTISLSSGKTLDIVGFFGSSNGLSKIEFADGVVLSASQIANAASESLFGGTGDDTLTATAGTDVLKGNGGNDTYLYSSTNGDLTIDNTPSTNLGTLEFSDLSPSNVALSRIAGTNDLNIHVLTNGHDIVIKSQFDPWQWGALHAIVFADGTQWTGTEITDHANQILQAETGGSEVNGTLGNDTLLGSDGDDALNGGAGRDVLYAGAGNNVLTAGTGADLFVVGSNASSNTINGFRSGTDKIKIDSLTFSNYAAFIASASDQTGSIVATASDGSSLIISGLTLPQIQSTDFIFAPVLDATGHVNLAASSIAGNDGAGTFFFESANASPITNIGPQDDVSNLVLTDTASTDVTLSRVADSSDLTIKIVSTGQQIVLSNVFDQGVGDGLSVSFDDGVSWSLTQVESQLLSIESKSPYGIIYGFSGDDQILAGADDHILIGKDGSDTYRYAAADGNEIVDDQGQTGTNSLTFTDLERDQITLSSSANGSDAIATIGSTGRSILLKNELVGSPSTIIQTLNFSDQSSVALSDELLGLIASGAKVQISSLGDDTLVGGFGTNGFVYSSFDGDLTISSHHDGASADVLAFTDLTAADISTSRVGNDLLIHVDATDSLVTISNIFASASSDGIQKILFADGTSWNRTQINAAARYYLGDGDISFTAQNGGWTIVDGTGDDTIIGGDGDNNGNDTFVYSATDGNLTLIDHRYYGNAESDLLKLTDLNINDLTFTRVNYDLIITVNATGKIITSPNSFVSPGDGVQQIEFADGTLWNRAQIQAAAWYRAGAGDVVVTAENGDATLVAGPGNDTLVGGNVDNYASDTFIYSSTNGNLSIQAAVSSWNTLNNTLKLSDLNEDDVVVSRVNNDLLLTVKSTGHVITVPNEFISLAQNGIQQVQFADGTIWDRATIQNNAWYRAGSGDVVVTAENGNATLVAGPGNDTLVGGNLDNYASDTFIYSANDGNLSIVAEVSSWNQLFNTLKFTDLNPDDVTLARVNNDLLITVKDTGRVIAVPKEFMTLAQTGIQQIQFANGTLWNRTQILEQSVITGTSGNDQLSFSGSGTLDMLQGDDSVEFFSAGNVTVLFAKGDGHDAYWANSPSDLQSATLKLLDINSDDVTFTFNPNYLHAGGIPNDITLTVNDTGDSVNLGYENWPGQSAFGEILFADGSVITQAQIRAAAVYKGTAGNDNISFGGPGTLDMGAGDDVVRFDSGNDTNLAGNITVLFQKGDGHDTYYAYYPNDLTNGTLKLIGIAPNEVSVSINPVYASDVLVTITSTGDSVDLGHELDPNFHAFDQIVFDDGTVWTRSQINTMAHTVTGTPGTASSAYNRTDVSNLIYDLGSGDYDNVTAWHDDPLTIEWGSGDGNQAFTVESNYYTNDAKVVLQNLNVSDLQFERTGANAADLTILNKYTGKTLTIHNQFPQPWEGIASITFADGTVWNQQQIVANSLILGTPGAAQGAYDTSNDANLVYDLGSGDYGNVSAWHDDPLTIEWADGDGNQSFTIESNNYTNDAKVTLLGLNPSDLQFERTGTNGIDLTIVNTSTGKTLTLHNQFQNSWQGAASIVFADGTIWNQQQISTAAPIFGTTSGQSRVISGNGLTFIAVAGDNEAIQLVNASNVTVEVPQGVGGAGLMIYPNGTGDLHTGIVKLEGIDPANVVASRDIQWSSNLNLTDVTSGDLVILGNELDNNFSDFDQVEFDDGTIWTRSFMEAHLGYVVARGYTLYLNTSSPVSTIYTSLGGGGLNYSGAGGTTIAYHKADGNFTINDTSTVNNPSDDLVLDDVNRADVTITQNGYDMILTVSSTGSKITLRNQFAVQGSGISSLTFADGTVLNVSSPQTVGAPYNTLPDIPNLITTPTNTSDMPNPTYDLGSGDYGNVTANHDDPLTLDWGKHSGNQTFTIESNNYTNDAKAVLAGLNPNDVTLLSGGPYGTDLLITNNETGKTLTVVNEFYRPWQGVGTITFGDGTVMDQSAIQARATADAQSVTQQFDSNGALISEEITQSGGGAKDFYYGITGQAYASYENDYDATSNLVRQTFFNTDDSLTIEDFRQNAVLDAQSSNTTLIGNAGNDTFVYEAQDANSHIESHTASSGATLANSLNLVDLNPTDLTLSRNGSDLLVGINATSRVITIDGEFNSPDHDGIQQIAFANGTVWNRDQIVAHTV